MVEFLAGSFEDDFFLLFVGVFRLLECDCIISGIGLVMFRFLKEFGSCLFILTLETLGASSFRDVDDSESGFWLTFNTSGAEENDRDLS